MFEYKLLNIIFVNLEDDDLKEWFKAGWRIHSILGFERAGGYVDIVLERWNDSV